MSDTNLPPEQPPEGEFLLYQTDDGQTRIECRFSGQSIWLTQRQHAELFQTSVPNVNQHLKAIYDEGELDQQATIKKYLIVQTEGNREVSRQVEHYKLDAVLSVGYRVRSHRGTQFRIWATARLREYLEQPNMGLTSWSGPKPRKSDVVTAKNYLNQNEIEALNRIVTAYLEFAELQALNRKSMADWITKLDDFLKMSDREILPHAGKISHEDAREKAEVQYEIYSEQQSTLPKSADEHFNQ